VLRVGSGDRRRWEACAHAAHLTATAALPVHAAMAQNICSTHAQKLQHGAGRARQTPTGAQVGCGRERELRKLRARGAWPCERKSRSNACMVEVIWRERDRGQQRGEAVREGQCGAAVMMCGCNSDVQMAESRERLADDRHGVSVGGVVARLQSPPFLPSQINLRASAHHSPSLTHHTDSVRCAGCSVWLPCAAV